MEIKLRHWMIALLVAALTHSAVALALVRAPQPQIDKPIVVTISSLILALGSNAEQGGSGGGAEGAATAAPAAKTKPKTKAPAVSRAGSRSKKAAASKSVSDAKPSARSASRRKLGTDSGRGSAQKRGARKGKGAGNGRGKGKGAGSGKGKGKGGGKRAANYYGRLAAHLNRHKRYPSQARRKRAQGTVKVSFTIDRRGRVVSQRIVRSSGHAALDREVRAMLKRASPLPRIPAEMNRGSLTVTLPIVFSLR